MTPRTPSSKSRNNANDIACNNIHGDIAQVQVGTSEHLLNGVVYRVEVFPGNAAANNLSVNYHEGLCFSVFLIDGDLAKTYTFRVTAPNGEQWIWESGPTQ